MMTAKNYINYGKNFKLTGWRPDKMFSEKFIKNFVELLVSLLLEETTEFSYGENYLYAKGITINKNKIIIDATIDDAFIIPFNLACLNTIFSKNDYLFEYDEFKNLPLKKKKEIMNNALDYENDLISINNIIRELTNIIKFKHSSIEMVFNNN